MINYERLHHAVMVAREGSYSAAAAAIPLSQSALTRSVQALEREYGIQVFRRGRLGARLTEQGAEFIRLAEQMLRRNAADAEALGLMAGSGEREVRFGMGSVAAALLLPRLLPQLQILGFRYRITVESTGELRRLLRSGQIDFFVGGVPAGSDNFTAAYEFKMTRVPDAGIGLLVREGHPLLGQRPRASSPSFPVAAGTFAQDIDTTSLFARFTLHGPVIEMDNYDLLAQLALATDFVLLGSTVLPSLRPELGLVAVPSSGLGELALAWGIAWPAKPDLSPTAQQIMAAIRDLMTDSIASADPPS